MRKALLLLLLPLVGLTVWLAGNSASGTSATSMYIYPDAYKIQGAQGGTFVASVFINNAKDVAGWEFEIYYDSAIVNATEGVEGDFLSYPDRETACSFVEAEGVAHFACVLLSGPGVTSSGDLGSVRFAFKEEFAGEFELLLVGCEAVDSDGDPVVVDGCDDALVTASPVPPPISMALSPATTKLQAMAGQTLTLDVMVGDAIDLGAIEFFVEFDDAVVNVDGIEEGPFLGTEGSAICVVGAPPASNQGHFGCVLLGKPGAEGNGAAAHLSFSIKAPFSGPTSITLFDCEAADIQGFNVPVSECAGATLQSNPTPTPTFTPAPPPPPVGGISRTPQMR